MDAREETKKVFLTEPLKKLIGYILASVLPFLLALIPRVRDLIQAAISFSLLLTIASVLLSGLILLAAYTYYLRKRLNQPISFNENENQFFNFRVINDSSHTIEFEVWYYYTGTLGADNVFISYLFYTESGEMIYEGTYTEFKVIAAKTKAIAKLSHTFKKRPLPLVIAGIELCMNLSMTPFHCQRFAYKKVWN
jgi:hypothetical protein